MAVLRAVLDHQDLAVTLDDLGLDLARLLAGEEAEILLAGEHQLARLLDAGRAERVGGPRPAQHREGALARLQERGRRPLGLKGPGFEPAVDELDDGPCCLRGTGRSLLEPP